MFDLAFFLGARPCEWLGLKWADVDWEGQRITIQRSLKWRPGADWYTTNPKTAKSIRTIALTETLMKGLQDHRRRQLEARLKAGASWEDHDFIFANEAGEPFRFESMRRLYKGILAAAKLPEKFMLKTSRHSCASALINEPDVPLKAISARFGHASIRTTADIYGVVDDERGRQVSERIGQLFGIGKK